MISSRFFGVVLASSFLVGSLSALSIDSSSTYIGFVGYKTSSKQKVPGNFKSVNVNYPKSSGSVVEILNGATGSIDLSSIDTKIPLRNDNIRNLFFSHFSTHSTKGTLKDAKGDDNSGTVTLALELNGTKGNIPLTYKNDSGKLTLTGSLDLHQFAKSAFDEFANHNTIQALHSKKTWNVIDVVITVNTK